MTRLTPTESLSLALFHEWRPDELFVIINVYIDESGTHDAPHLTLGGWVGKFGQWAEFDKKWRRLLKKNGLTYFHSKEMRHSKGEFDGWDDDDKCIFMAKAAKLAQRHILYGFTFYLDKSEYAEIYRAEHTSQDLPLDSIYQVAFRSCLYFAPELTLQSLPGKDIELHFIVEDSQHFDGVHKVFREVKKHAPQEFTDLLGDITRGAKKKYPGLQVADVNAYNAFRFEGDVPKMRTFDLPSDDVWKVARKRSRCPIFRCVVNEGELDKFKSRVLSRYGDRLEKRKASAEQPS